MNFLVFGKPVLFEFGENIFSINNHFEPAVSVWRQFKGRNLLLVRLEKVFCQAYSLRFVVSRGAVFDGNFHGISPNRRKLETREMRNK